MRNTTLRGPVVVSSSPWSLKDKKLFSPEPCNSATQQHTQTKKRESLAGGESKKIFLLSSSPRAQAPS